MKKSGRSLSFKRAVSHVRKAIKSKNAGSDIKRTAKIALRAARGIKRKIISKPRIIPIPKTGGFLPLIPIFAGLSALGTLSGGAAAIAKAVNDSRAAAAQLKESQRHNETMESIAIGKGLYLKPYKNGLGLHLKQSKNYR